MSGPRPTGKNQCTCYKTQNPHKHSNRNCRLKQIGPNPPAALPSTAIVSKNPIVSNKYTIYQIFRSALHFSGFDICSDLPLQGILSRTAIVHPLATGIYRHFHRNFDTFLRRHKTAKTDHAMTSIGENKRKTRLISTEDNACRLCRKQPVFR